MFISSFRSFIRDESGAYAIWSLIWFSLYIAIGGLAVDMTDAYRNQTMLQSTADASALAGAMSLPNAGNAVAEALGYSIVNMDPGINENGNVLKGADVIVGAWNFDTKTFSTGGGTPATVEAVLVTTRRSNSNNNALATNFLRIMNLWGVPGDVWNINTEAVAVKYVPACINDGFVAQGRVSYRDNNGFFNGICVHGQDDGVSLRGQDNYHEPGVRVSMSDLNDLDAPGQAYGTVQNALVEGDLYPRDVGRLDAIITGLRNLDPNYLPDYMVDVDSSGNRTVASNVQVVAGSSLPATTAQYTVYDISCNDQIELPGTLMSKVVVVADCRIHSSLGANLQDAVLATSQTGRNSVHMEAQSTLGLNDDCAPGGGLEIYTLGDVRLRSNGEWHGLRVVSGEDVRFKSNIDGVWGMSVQAGSDILLNRNNDFGLCAGGNPGNPAYHYRLVL